MADKSTIDAIHRYKAKNYAEMRFMIKKAGKERLTSFIESKGKTINQYITESVSMSLKNDGMDDSTISEIMLDHSRQSKKGIPRLPGEGGRWSKANTPYQAEKPSEEPHGDDSGKSGGTNGVEGPENDQPEGESPMGGGQ